MSIDKAAEKFEQFKSSFFKHSYLQITDNNEVIVDRCDKILTYDENLIKLSLVNNILTVTGSALKMRNFSSEGVIISGEFTSLEFSKRKK